MDLCSKSHNEVCYNGNECPVCKIMKEVEGLKNEIVNLQDEINTYEEET
jgi:hypothetical protein